MTWPDWLRRLIGRPDDCVSETTLRHHLRHELSRGVDLPYWRQPKAVARMRRQEARQMRLVKRG
jgi:hypothetical protein